MRRAAQVAAMPIVAGMIYAWLLKQAVRDAVGVAGRRFWPAQPIDHP
jgi:hypothetical protein